jgi:signal transduction histidine kinase
MAAVEERTRIAREIHDIVAHSVSVMIALSEGAAATPDDGQARSSMRQVAATGREALGELRRVLSVLRSSPARQGGGHHQEADRDPQPTLASLEKLADDVRAAGLSVHLEVDGDVGQLPDAMQATVFRVVQEAFTNTLKHGRDVHRSDVVVEVGPEQVRVVIRDDGRPSDVREAARSVPAGSAIGSSGSGSGLRGMRERAEMFGGSVATRALPTGWEVVCLLDRRARGVS